MEDNYENGQAEALNNIAFYDIVKMDFGKADSVLNRVKNTTDNEVELFVADVQQMRICQRKSANKDYYVFQNSAQTRLKRIKESKRKLQNHRRAEGLSEGNTV